MEAFVYSVVFADIFRFILLFCQEKTQFNRALGTWHTFSPSVRALFCHSDCFLAKQIKHPGSTD